MKFQGRESDFLKVLLIQKILRGGDELQVALGLVAARKIPSSVAIHLCQFGAKVTVSAVANEGCPWVQNPKWRQSG